MAIVVLCGHSGDGEYVARAESHPLSRALCDCARLRLGFDLLQPLALTAVSIPTEANITSRFSFTVIWFRWT